MTRRLALVGALYVAALLVAWAAVAASVALTGGPDRQASGGMYAFGDFLLFMAVLGVASVPASGLALFYLRPLAAFWKGLSVAAVAMALTGVAAAGVYLGARGAAFGSPLHSWASVAVLRVLVAPLLALGGILAGVLAPTRSSRYVLLGTALAETAAFGSVVASWVLQAGR